MTSKTTDSPAKVQPWTAGELHLHKQAVRRLETIFQAATALVSRKKSFTEEQLYNFMVQKMRTAQMTSVNNWAIVAYGKSAADPHYRFAPGKSRTIKPGHFLLLDIWGKINRPDAPYADITHMYFVGKRAPARFQKLWNDLRDARDKALNHLSQNATAHGAKLHALSSDHLDRCGYKNLFIHGLGHDLGHDHPHGPGINLSPRFRRSLERGRGYTIEPGIYKSGQFGLRSEINLFLDHHGRVQTTSTLQHGLQLIH
ncbi:hypothetical protein A3F52_02795 [Candidatus Uhrbacteria bacterium RIFCSPHIGHO2_12_FULL_47_11]|nr:MAG: hypothetical protein A3F52_02795 [Candidatus Uhrbacteria bacterium RIFCSPHIGHO2_12_FULL_47_11]OGL83867.1 MAG: hypothetical protein A3J03_01920 [Candidatus Uhrbacteria bacterium RIFCSPLOWO2_02_FULL_46_25]OGL91871.1 MAG: hypothetical protein A3H11_01765 [Candidatus Uhrbacteria bacterium RIFCSPLOWO2_12_FULL_47_10]